MHQLDGTLSERGSALAPGVHQSKLAAICNVSDDDGTIDWVIVLGHVQDGREVPGRPIVQDALLHLQAVGVRVEGLVIVDVRGVELDDYLLALGRKGDTAELQGPFGHGAGLEGPHN
jgi:hypothetical protein